MFFLGFFSFIDFEKPFPLSDKLARFLCFCIATGMFYFIVDVEE